MKNNRITTILLAVALLFFLSFCASTDDDDDDDDKTTTPTETKFEVTSTSPTSGATDIGINQNITATFSKNLKNSTVTETSFTLKDTNNSTVASTVTPNGKVATLNPNSDLSENTTYTATLTTDIQDSDGNALSAAKSWSFTTASTPDTTKPEVTATNPIGNSTNATTTQSITATFSEDMTSASINSTTFTLTKSDNSTVNATVNYANKVATLDPKSNLSGNTTYMAKIASIVTDLARNQLGSDYSWNFTTTAPDSTAPTLQGRTPTVNATQVPLSTNVTVTFNEDMKQSSFNSTSFTLTKSDNSMVNATDITVSGMVATFDPDGDLSVNTTYTAKIASTVTDLSGNQLGSDYSWNFTTIVENISPTVTSKTPANGTTDVAASPTFIVKFSEKLDNTTVNSTRFTLMDSSNNTKLLKNFNYDDNLTVTFQPNSGLSANTNYTVKVTAGIKDLNGNALTPLSWEFHTDSAPGLSIKLPMNNSTAAKNTNVIVVFDKEMNTGSINSTTFLVSNETINISGNVSHSYNNMQALFNPTDNLTNATKYTVTVLDSVKSSKGFAMAQNATFSFNATDSADATAPTVDFSPTNGNDSVAKSANVTLTFDKDMNPATVKDNVVLKLKNPPSTAVGYSFSFNNGKVFTLNPNADLTTTMQYTVSLNSSVLDLSGNALTGISANFTTTN